LNVCVVGAGHIGLPTASIIADHGFNVIAADVNEHIVDCINKGEAHMREQGIEKLVQRVVKSGALKATTDVGKAASNADVILIIVPTPLEADGPNLRHVLEAAEVVAKHLKKGALVILESTVYPGATKNILCPLIEKYAGKVGEDFYLAYSPERAIPTRSLKEITGNVRIVGGVDEASSLKAEEFYSQFVNEVVNVHDSNTAEFIKICENVYRDVNIALANEIALIAGKMDIDVKKVIKAANKHPRVNLHVPGAGVGGHCIPKDPYFLINKGKDLGLPMNLIRAARGVNEKMPEHVVELVEEGLEHVGKTIEESKVAVLGFAYKGDTSDIRGAPSEEIIKRLKKMGCTVKIQDPYVNHSNGIKIQQEVFDVVNECDCIVLVTDHSDYRNINIEKLAKIMKKPAVFIDGRNFMDEDKLEKAGFEYYGVGR